MSIGKKGGFLIFLLGVLATLIFCYFLLGMFNPPNVMKNIMRNLNNTPAPLENQFKQILSSHNDLKYLVLQGPDGKNLLNMKKKGTVPAEEIIELKRNFGENILKAGFSKKAYYKKTAGHILLVFGFCLTLLLAFTVSVFIQGLAEKLQLISAYLKESDLADIDELVKEEDWPPEIRRLISSIDILLKKIEKNLKIKIEEAKRDKLFAHNSIVGLVDCLDKISQGDLRVRATSTPDMIGALGEAFNDAMASLGEKIERVKKLTEQLQELLQDNGSKAPQAKECLDKLSQTLGRFYTEA